MVNSSCRRWWFLIVARHTGDVSFSAQSGEFTAAAAWLDRLLAAVGTPRDAVVVVPGNHDVDRKEAVASLSVESIHAALRASPAKVDMIVEKAADAAMIWPKLSAYSAFAATFGCAIDPEKPFFRRSCETAFGSIDLIGLNSALASFDSGDAPGNLALGNGQINAVTSEDRARLGLVFGHHPPEWLVDGDPLLASLQHRPHILFTGHVHKQRGHVRLSVTGGGVLHLSAGAGHKDSEEAGEHGYAWGQLNSKGLLHFARQWWNDNRCFVAAPLLPEQSQHEDGIGSYSLTPLAKLPDRLKTWLESATQPTLPPAPIQPPIAAPAPAVTADPSAYDLANAYFAVPYHAKGEKVIGAAAIMAQLHEQLRRSVGPFGPAAALVGVGGLGKTQMAVEYAHRHRADYPGGVFWFAADQDLDAQVTRLVDNARWLHPSTDHAIKLAAGTHQIRTRSNCLIIFDNVESFAAIKDLLPEPPARPHLLVTGHAELDSFAAVNLDILSQPDAIALLASESERSTEAETDREAAAQIATDLDCLPLALELAGAYLKRRPRVSLAAYAEKVRLDGLQTQGLAPGHVGYTKHHANLRTALRLGEGLFQEEPLMRTVLDALTWSGTAAMGMDLLATLVGVAPADVDLASALDIAELLRILRREQRESGAADAFRMHRLVCAVRREDMPLASHAAAAGEMLSRIVAWFEGRRAEFDQLAAFEAEIDHLERWQQNAVDLGATAAAARLQWLAAYPHHHRGRPQEVLRILAAATTLLDSAPGEDAILRAHLANDRGWALGVIGEHRAALACEEVALGIRKAVLSDGHPDTAMSLDNLGGTYAALGEHRRALDYMLPALAIRKAALGEKHPDTATSLNNLGSTYRNLGTYRTALDYHLQALHIIKAALGEKHPNTATSLSNLGSTYGALGDRRKALDHHLQALAIREEVLGEKHPDTATSLNNLGFACGELGEHQKRLDYHLRALAIREAVQGENHPSTATSLSNLGIAYHALGEDRKALDCLLQALAIRKHSLGYAHPDTVSSLRTVAQALAATGKASDADALLVDAYRDLLATVGPAHTATVEVATALAKTKWQRDKYEPALELVRECLRKLPAQHPSRPKLERMRDDMQRSKHLPGLPRPAQNPKGKRRK